jgi:flagellin
MFGISAMGVYGAPRASVARSAGVRASVGPISGRAAPDSAPGVLNSVGFSRADLLAMNAGIDQASRTSNALSTAGDAIGVIGGLLGNIQNVLTAAGSAGTMPLDPTTEQSRIDSAITTIDAIASSSRFGGQRLLDGSFNATSSAAAVAIPSFVSSTLGSSPQDGSSTPPLSSLLSGGSNDLATGNLDAAGRIVTTAMSQVGQTQAQIEGFVTATRVASNAQAVDADAASSTASDMFADPSTTSVAAANASAQRVLALLGP